jgi:hypothetical protein
MALVWIQKNASSSSWAQQSAVQVFPENDKCVPNTGRKITVNRGVGKFLCFFSQAPRHEGVFTDWRYSSTYSLTSAFDGVKWSGTRPRRFIPRERAPITHGMGDWVGSRAVLDAVVKSKIPSHRRESNPRTPIFQPVAQRYTDWAITALGVGKGKRLSFPCA